MILLAALLIPIMIVMGTAISIGTNATVVKQQKEVERIPTAEYSDYYSEDNIEYNVDFDEDLDVYYDLFNN